MRLFKKLRRKLDYLSKPQIEQIEKAFLVAFDAHKGQARRTGEPYITHPVEVSCILADIHMDDETIMAALMHDVIEDTPVTKKILAEKFSEEVAELVDGVTKLTQIEFISRAEAQAENFRKMVLAMAKDIRVIIVKLADRLHNMRTLGAMPAHKQQRIAKETLGIFAPIAKRLGMRDFSVELEELSFSALHPMRYRILGEAVRKARGNRKKVLSMIEKTLKEGMSNSPLPSCKILGREKHLYSIYRKMTKKNIPFNEIMDVYAFRMVVEDVDTCYRVLGVIHSLFKPVPERFKDYIAIPKANGYQSLHTTLFGPYGLPIEVQIRTKEMDKIANSGIAAHWLYKSDDVSTDRSQVRAKRWVENLLELQSRTGNSLEFIESVKVDLFPDEVYVFTPKGTIMELPAGATAIDFAYTVHTDIGNSCVAVKIDRQLAPLSTRLANGQTVEVITAPGGRPNPAWLDFVATSKARSSIRHFLKNRKRGESVALGRQLLKKALATYAIQLKKVNDATIEFVLKEMHLNNFDDLLEEVGLGNRVPALVAERIVNVIKDRPSIVDRNDEEQTTPLMIMGTEGMLVNFATCCYPIPGDPIVGILNPGEGISVHVQDCKAIAKLHQHPERCMPLRWAENAQGEFVVVIRVEVKNERGILASMALAVSDTDANIDDINVEDRDGHNYIVTFKLLVQSRAHLAKVLRHLRGLPQVTRISRR